MYQEIIDFWFTEIEPVQWWEKDEVFDVLIENRFASLHQQAKAGELILWRESALGSLAEIIILEQFSRNIYREKPESFRCDPLALELAQGAITKGFDLELSQIEHSVFYLPYMHSESRLIHKEALRFYESLGNPNTLEFEQMHKTIIDRFGRYPHRNHILDRESTAEEIEFLKQPNSGF